MEHGDRLIETFKNGSSTVHVYAAATTYKSEEERQQRIDDFHLFRAECLIEDKRRHLRKKPTGAW